MSGRSFIDRAAEEWRKGLVVGRVVPCCARPLGRLELVEHGLDGLFRITGRIGWLALPLHRVEIVHVGLIGPFIVAKQAHRTSRTKQSSIRRPSAPGRSDLRWPGHS